MKTGFAITAGLLAVVVAYVAIGAIISDWERPPVDAVQTGYRGLAMEQISNPRTRARDLAANQMPDPLEPVAPGGGPASQVYENVQVLTDLSVDEFNRLMEAITAWVAPEEESCLYCHNAENLADDSVYAKVVSRRMLQMTRDINANWESHVGETGVTCYTCHRGQPVPSEIWFMDPGPPSAKGMAAGRAGQNIAAPSVGLTSLPLDPFTPFLGEETEIRVASTTALPTGNKRDIKQTEWTYGLMIHMSESLGVNCTYCHNTRSFFAWDASTPQRTTAWHGIRMVRDLNNTYLQPLQPAYPPNRLGPEGDAPKANCATCHQGANKPLYGANMLRDYPELGPR